MKTSQKGRDLIVAREGKRLLAYRDSVGVWTIGVGHTGRMAPPPVGPGMRITDAQCDAYLAADLAPVERVLNNAVKVPMTQNEFDAMASLGFNIGVNGLARSMVVRRLNLGDVRGAADAFMGWSKPAVLIGRRKAERAQFLAPDPKTRPVAVARGDMLSAQAETAKADAARGTKTAAGLGAATAVIAAAQPAASQHHGLLWIIVALGVVATAAAAVIAIRNRRRATALAVNATAAHGPDAGATDALQH